MAWQGVPPNEIAPDGSRGIGILNPATLTELEEYAVGPSGLQWPRVWGSHFPARGIWPRKYAPHRVKFVANAEEKKRRKVKRKYEVPPGTYRIEWANANPSGASHVEFEYEGGTWYNFDDKWMDVFVEHAVPKVTKDGDKLGEMHSFDAETKLGKDSCCCGATKENPCECMIQGIMQCSATCPCSLAKKGAESFEAITVDSKPKMSGGLICGTCNDGYNVVTCDDCGESWCDNCDTKEGYHNCNTKNAESFSAEHKRRGAWMGRSAYCVCGAQIRRKKLTNGLYIDVCGQSGVRIPDGQPPPKKAESFSAQEKKALGGGTLPVPMTWMAETEGPSESKSSLDSTNLTHWANANDSDDIKYLVGGFIGGVLATAVGAIAGEWAVQRMKKHGKLI